MEIRYLNEDVIETIFYETIQGNGKVVEAQLPIQVGEIIGLPEYLDGIIVTSDLQGLVQMDDKKILLGEATAALLPLLLEIEFNLDAKKIGVFLCGDFFATLDRRGGVGDVRNVWDAFNKNFRWVTGVAGNHDMFGNEEEFKVFKDKQGIHYLNKEENKIENIRIAGLSGIIGKPDRVNRVKKEDYFQKLKILLRKNPDILILHQTPNNPLHGLNGDNNIREIIERSNPTLIFCGHYHWENALTKLSNKTQVLNVDSRVVILLKKLS